MPNDLKPCPCCEYVAQYSWWGVNGHDTPPKERSHTVRCTNENCHLETPHAHKRYTQEEARAIWNRRPRKKPEPRTIAPTRSWRRLTKKQR